MMSHLDQLHKSVCYSGLSLVLLLLGVSGVQAQTGQRFKRIDYHYDLISGKVNEVLYQASQPDAFYHKYDYDADNRITKVHTSKDSISWDQDASYMYYAHGPLARVELGDNKVQGLDYAYTLQGWIKGVNSNLLKAENDIGSDGLSGSAHSRVAKDAFGYSLNYHANDYKPIEAAKWSNTALRFEALTSNSDLMAARFDLYNGNISSMVTTIVEPKVYTGAANEVPNILPQGTAYKYDQLNRLLEMKAFQNLGTDPTILSSFNKWQLGSTYTGLYHNVFEYDANGNILYQERAGQNGLAFDKLTYQYKTDASGQRRLQNRLYHVNDANTDATLATDDIEDQGSFTPSPNINDVNNYRYDEIGNLKYDSLEGIAKIEWTVYGKIKSITRTAVSLRSDLEFQYDASGNRIAKIEKPRDANGVKPASEWIATYYTRDAQGNVMGIYKHQPLTVGPSFKVTERNVYGSSRLGSDYSEVELINALPVAGPFVRVLGNKHFEGSNHLRNVLVVLTDKNIPGTSNGTTINYFNPNIVNTYDYTPFGAPLPQRSYRLVMKKGPNYASNPLDLFPAFVNEDEPVTNIVSENPSYKYGFNAQEKDDELKGKGNSINYEFRLQDPRIGRFFAVDPVATKYPYNSPYAFCENRVIDGFDLEGLEYVTVHVLDNEDKSQTELCRENHYLIMSNADVQRVHGDVDKFYKEYSAPFESEGRGVKYEYYKVGPDGIPILKKDKDPTWESRQDDGLGDILRHGIWAGAGGIVKLGSNRKIYPNADASFGYVDEVDRLAKDHDFFYDYEGYEDGDSRKNNYTREAINADQTFLNGIKQYIARYENAKKNGEEYIDQVSGRAVSAEAIQTARLGAWLFSRDIKKKEERLAKQQKKDAE